MKKTEELSVYVKIRNRLRKYVEERCGDTEKGWMGWPTVRELAKRYHLGQQIIIDMVEECEDLDLIVGMRTHSGYGTFENQGDYRVEWYGDEEQ